MGLQEKTVSKMVDQDIDSLSVVVLMREADISALSLSIGQMLLLSRWVFGLRDTNSRYDSSPSEPASDEATLLVSHHSSSIMSGTLPATAQCV